MLENSGNIPQKTQEYLNKLKLKKQQFNDRSSRKVSGPMVNILNNESIVIKRLDYLFNEVKNLTDYGLSIIDLKSVGVLEHSIKLGLDINAQFDNTYLLKYALDNKNYTMANYLYALPDIDKLKIDNHGNNLAHSASLSKNYHMVYQLSKEHLHLFYVENSDNKTPIDIIFNYKQYDTLPKKQQLYIKESILTFFDAHYNQQHVLSDNKYNIINDSSVLKNVLIEVNYHELNRVLVSQKATPNKLRKI